MNREEVYEALFQKVGSLVEFKTKSRRLRHIEEVDINTEMPAVFQVQQDESWDGGRPNLPTKKVLNVEWWVYVGEPDTSAAPSSKLNPVLDAIDSVLGQDGSGLLLETLGGRVFNAKVSGTIEIIEGVLGDRALAIVPVRVVKAD